MFLYLTMIKNKTKQKPLVHSPILPWNLHTYYILLSPHPYTWDRWPEDTCCCMTHYIKKSCASMFSAWWVSQARWLRKQKTWKSIWLLVSSCTYHPLARACLFCFPDVFYICSCISIISSSLPLRFHNSLLLHLPVSSLTPPRLNLPGASRQILRTASLITSQLWEPSDSCPSTLEGAFWVLKGWKVHHYSGGQPDSLASLPTFCQFPAPAVSPKF